MLIITRNPGQVIRIELAPDTDPATPIGEILAEGAIEVIVAQVRGVYVKLGVSAPLALAIRRAET
jgi:sRNA-binding carbon storage regulator CsrA